MEKAKSVDQFIMNHPQWQEEIIALRNILLNAQLEESIKWSSPTYSYEGKNVVSIAALKHHFGLWFFEGALLKDNKTVLANAQEGKTSAMRQWRFTSFEEIDASLIGKYIAEAIANQKAGKIIKPQKRPLVIPEMLNDALQANASLNSAFNSLSHSCKREYADHIAEAKKEATKQRRLDKITPMILNRVGLNDKYKNC